MEHLITSLQAVVFSIKQNYQFVLMILGGLWLFNIINWTSGSHLNKLGIYPRNIYGLSGIVFSPLLHYDFNHLFFNSVPLFVLINLVLIKGQLSFYYITLIIVLISGILTWLMGRKAIHIGASSVIMGYFGFILANAYADRSMITIIAALLGLYYLGGLLLALIPTGEKHISWEGHIFGFIAGICAAFCL